MLLYVALCHLRLVPDLSEDAGLHDRVAMILVALAFGLTVGGIFEIWEWFSNSALGTNMFVSYGDSIGDLIDDTLGALMGGVILLFWTGRGWGTWRTAGAALRGVEPMPTAPPNRHADLLARFGAWVAGLRPPRGHAGDRVRPSPVLPRWLVGDWGTVLRDPVDLIRLSLFAGALAAVLAGDWGHAVRFAVGFGLSALVRLAEAPRPFDAAFALGMAFQPGARSPVPSRASRATRWRPGWSRRSRSRPCSTCCSSAPARCRTSLAGATSTSGRASSSPRPASASAPGCSTRSRRGRRATCSTRP
jgi:hypothetical protein